MTTRETVLQLAQSMKKMVEVLNLHNQVLEFLLDELKEKENKGVFNEMDRDIEKFNIECEEFFKGMKHGKNVE